MALTGQRSSVGRVRERHGKPLRLPLTERSHQEVSAELVDAAAVEADDSVAPGQQEDDRAGLLTPEE